MSKTESKKSKVKKTNKRFTLKVENSKILKSTVETLSAIFDEINFIVNSKGFIVKGMDPSRICLLKLEFRKESFDEFLCTQECKVGLNLADLDKILKRSGTKDSLELNFYEKDQKIKIKMIREGSTRSRTFSLACLDLDIEDVPMENLINIEFPSSWSIEPDFFIEAIKDAEIYSEILNIEASEKIGLKFFSAGQIGEMEYQLGLEDFIESDLRETQAGAYSLGFLKSIMKIAPITEKLEISLKTDHPIKLFFRLLEGAELQYFLAPRVEEAEISEDDFNEFLDDNITEEN